MTVYRYELDTSGVLSDRLPSLLPVGASISGITTIGVVLVDVDIDSSIKEDLDTAMRDSDFLFREESPTLPYGTGINDIVVIQNVGGSAGLPILDGSNLTGISGTPGPSGEQGPAGPSGAQGIAGPSGATGAQGIQGPSGVAGPSGAQGPQGIQGPSGVAGPSGAQGLTGPAGPPGSGIITPNFSTDNTIVRWSGTLGDTIQNSLITIDDNGNINMPSGQMVGGTRYGNGRTWIEIARENYITVTTTSGVLCVLNSTPSNWEKHTIKDGSGVADILPITIHGSGNTIDGDISIDITNKYGAITLVFNTMEWNII